MNLEEKTINSTEIFKGRIINLRVDEVLLPNDTKSTREIIEHPGAVAIVAVDSDDNICMVRQYRKPVEKEMLEIPAGKLDPGEDPLDCAKRELTEETGLTALNWEKILFYYTTPGFSNEILHLYLATNIIVGDSNPDIDEFLEVKKVPLKEAYNDIFAGQITDGKSIIGIQYVYNKLLGG